MINFDKNTIQIIKQNINGLNKISNERIFDELKKILSLKRVQDLFTIQEFKEIQGVNGVHLMGHNKEAIIAEIIKNQR